MLQNGHKEHDVLGYSVEKFNLYVKAAQRKEAGDRVTGIVDMSVTIAGVLGGGKKMAEHLEGIEDSIENG